MRYECTTRTDLVDPTPEVVLELGQIFKRGVSGFAANRFGFDAEMDPFQNYLSRLCVCVSGDTFNMNITVLHHGVYLTTRRSN